VRRRLFWTIAGVAATTGFLVLAGAVIASQRAAVDATQRELARSSQEIVAIIEEAVRTNSQRPAALIEIIGILEGEKLSPLLGRVRRAAGSTELAFAGIAPDGTLRSNHDLFDRIPLDLSAFPSGASQFVRSTRNELVVVTPTVIPVRNLDITVLLAVAREAPVVQLRDMGRGLVLVALGLVLVSAVLARVLSDHVTRRLSPLSMASRRLAAGDLTARVPDLGDPDLDELAESFNEMAGELEATRVREREFILGVGHDLRTPLTTIGGYAEALESGAVEPQEIAKIGAILGTQSRQLGRLIEDLSLLARLEQPEFGLRIEPVDVGAHVAEIVEGFRRRADEMGIRLEVNAEPGLELETDPDRLGQVAQNLVENALRFTPEAGQVTVEVRSEEEQVLLIVSDTGTGIGPEDLPHVFGRHYVGRQRRVRNEGSGLGLSIVKGLVERLGGGVTAESQPGKGTTITVKLPR
jgi:signal transduction histidine kinase